MLLVQSWTWWHPDVSLLWHLLLLTRIRRLFILFVLDKCYPHLHNSVKPLCTWGERSIGQRFCAWPSESFWVRVTIDDLTDFLSQSLLTITACLGHLLHVFCILQHCCSLVVYNLQNTWRCILFFLLFNSKLNSDLFLSFPVFFFYFNAADGKSWQVSISIFLYLTIQMK